MDINNTLTEIKTILADLTFPAHKDEVTAKAEQSGASDEAKQLLAQLPAENFGSIEELISKLPLDTVVADLEKML